MSEIKMRDGYAETVGTRAKNWGRAETVVVGSEEIASARYVGRSSAPGFDAWIFRIGRRLYAQIARD